MSLVGAIGGVVVSWFLLARQHSHRLREQEQAFNHRMEEARRKWLHDAQIKETEHSKQRVDQCISSLSALDDAAHLVRQAADYLSHQDLFEAALQTYSKANHKARKATYLLNVAGREQCEKWWDEIREEFDAVQAMAVDQEPMARDDEPDVLFQYAQPDITELDKAIKRLRARAVQLSRQLEQDRD